jgi:hypothetical protein
VKISLRHTTIYMCRLSDEGILPIDGYKEFMNRLLEKAALLLLSGLANAVLVAQSSPTMPAREQGIGMAATDAAQELSQICI